jgi:sec-independent protein translocase protein TatA
MINGLTPTHLIILVLVIVLLFGAKKLPDAARSLGKSMRIFKSEVKEMGKDDDEHPTQQAQTPREVEGRIVDTPPAAPPAAAPVAEPQRATTPGEHPERDH